MGGDCRLSWTPDDRLFAHLRLRTPRAWRNPMRSLWRNTSHIHQAYTRLLTRLAPGSSFDLSVVWLAFAWPLSSLLHPRHAPSTFESCSPPVAKQCQPPTPKLNGANSTAPPHLRKVNSLAPQTTLLAPVFWMCLYWQGTNCMGGCDKPAG